MRRYQFRLQTLLNYRKMLTNQAQAELGRAVKEWQMQVDILNSLTIDNENVEAQLRKIQQKPVAIDELLDCHTYGALIKHKIQQQRERVQSAERYCSECRAKLAETMKHEKLVQKLKEKRLAQYKEELLCQEQKDLDEIGLQLYTRGESTI